MSTSGARRPCATATSTAGSPSTETRFSIYLPAGGAVRGAVLPAHHSGAGQREPRAGSGGRGGQDRVLDRQRRLLRRDQRRRDVGQPGLRRWTRRSRAYRANAAAAQLLARGRGRDVRRAPALRLRLRRQRRRLPHDRRAPRTPPASGTASSPTSSARRWRSRTCSPSACTRSGSCATVLDRIVDAVEPGGSGDMYAGLDDGGARRARRGDAHGLPAALVVRPPHDGDARLPGALPRPGHGRPHLLRGLLDPARLPRCTRRRRRSSGTSCSTDARWSADDLRPARRRSSVCSGGGRAGSVLHTASAGRRPSIAVAVRLTSAPDGSILGAELIVISGAAAGARAPACSRSWATSRSSARRDPEVVAQLQPRRRGRGRQPRASSPRRPTTATRCRRRDFSVWDQFRKRRRHADLSRSDPCCSARCSPAAAAGTVPDRPLRREDDRRRVACWTGRRSRGRPTGTARRFEEHLGDATDDHFRLWFIDNALHGDDDAQEIPTRTRQLPRRAAPGAPRPARLGRARRRPAADHDYEVVDGQVVVPADRRRRGAACSPS